MLSAQWMNLVIILGLISYSYEYNRRHEQIRRRTRDSGLRYTAQAEINSIMNDDARLEDAVKDQMRKNDDITREITQKIMEAARKIADMGVQEVARLEQWTVIQQEIRRGLNVVIAAYRSFIRLQRATCDSLEAFSNDIITKYESELTAIDQLTPPTLSTGGIDTTNPLFALFRDKLLAMSNYGQFRGLTFPTDVDCPHDLLTRTLVQRAAVTAPVTTTYYVQVPPTNVVRSTDPGIPISCGSLAEYNGYQSCPYSIVNQARTLFTNACPNQCLIQ